MGKSPSSGGKEKHALGLWISLYLVYYKQPPKYSCAEWFALSNSVSFTKTISTSKMLTVSITHCKGLHNADLAHVYDDE